MEFAPLVCPSIALSRPLAMLLSGRFTAAVSARLLIAALGVAAWAVLSCATAGALLAAPPPSDNAGEQFHAWVEQLDDDRYEVRQLAAQRLFDLAGQPEHAQQLAAQVQEVLLADDTPLEVRAVLEPLARKLPPPAATARDISPEEIAQLVARLEAPHYAQRLSAAQRLRWLAEQSALADTVAWLLKRQLGSAQLSAEARRHLEPAYETARGKWLLSHPATWELPEVTEQQIERWLDDLAAGSTERTASGAWSAATTARTELLDLLVRPEYLQRVKPLLEQRLAKGDLPQPAADRYAELLEWTEPAMVAEYWQQGRHASIQHLLIGVPNHAAGAQRASLFDYCDEHRAHCVSGNSLSPGDYPVGVFFPHPITEDAQFHLVNLPTPLRRLAYSYVVQQDEQQRLAAITQRTTAQLLKQDRLLTTREVSMLPHLDAPHVSRLAARLMLRHNDSPDMRDDGIDLGLSHHTMLCYVLALAGTRDAMPELLEVIEKQRVLPPTESSTYRADWIAALCIAHRDPWPESGAWLARWLDRSEPLNIAEPDGATLGATAAGLLLEQFDVAPSAVGLELVGESLLSDAGCPGYRYATAEALKQVLRWWEHQQRTLAGGL